MIYNSATADGRIFTMKKTFTTPTETTIQLACKGLMEVVSRKAYPRARISRG
ncbi:MAG: hypothetical protein H6Q25_1116 [Bacteroidetes bacterium]|nr:hypothetical protein [Bacteroidota bacterium]